jgi:8-amino-7-oxononanoate synthase
MFHVKQGTPPALRFLDEALAEAARLHLLRGRGDPRHPNVPSFCSNDYLGLASRVVTPAASGAGASRLVSGDRTEHAELEEAIASLVRLPSALAFSSGYAANVGLMSCLARPGDLVVSDALNHASIIDGVRLSRCRTVVVPHLDLRAIESALRDRGPARAFVVTESYFSMDADSPDLPELRDLCDRYCAALVVDEAHALGVLGPGGAGLCAGAGVVPDALVGTFGKSFGAAGAFVAGCAPLVTWLWNSARSFVFSTGMSPAVALAARAGIEAAAHEPQRRERALAMADRLRRGLTALGVAPLGYGHVIPWVVGEPKAALDLARGLSEAGMDVRAIRPPSVPQGTARLRLTITADHSPTDVERLLAAAARLLPTVAR